MSPAALARWQAKRDAHHTYGFADGRWRVYEPAVAGGGIAATLSGGPPGTKTIDQADAICRALDRLAARAVAS